MDNILGIKSLWDHPEHPINVLEIIDGPDSWGLIRIKYKIKRGRKPYTLWCYPSDLKDVL